MDSIWTVLGLEPTQDISAIKRAYAQKSRECHPEEDPEGFLQLRKAYQAALDYAEGKEAPEPAAALEAEEPEEEAWSLTEKPILWDEGPNPYADHEAARKFLELYTGKQRKNTALWLDYFTSDAFLDIAWERRFTALLLEHVTRLEAEYPVNREFLNWLCIAYQFSVKRSVYRDWDNGGERVEFEFQIHREGQFDGQESVFEIATKGPAPKQPKGNELSMLYSFIEYRTLIHMAEDGIWSEKDVGAFSEIIGRYAAGYITDKCQHRGTMDYERHPAGLRLMTHFFRREGLPEEVCRIAWQKLDLKTALMGRAKILYGTMRELVLERLPELAGEQKVSYAKLRTAFFDYAVSTHKRNGEKAQATAEDIQKTDAFFAREDFQKGLLDRRFVEEEMLHTWVDEARCDYYLQRVIQFYEAHETAPCAQKVIERAKEMLKYQALADRLLADRETEISEEGITLKNASFFRHWLNTGFYHAQDRETGRGLIVYLNKELTFLPEWSRNFLKVEDGQEPIPAAEEYTLDGDEIMVCFHLRYQSFHINREQVYRPCIPWERVAAVTDTDAFCFLLPIATTAYDQYETVKAEILRRLTDTAAPETDRPFIAGCLADQVCGLPVSGAVGRRGAVEEEDDYDEYEEEDADGAGEEDGVDGKERAVRKPRRSLPPESVLPLEVFAEDADRLFVCVWFQQDEILSLYQQTPYGKQMVRDGRYDDVPDAQSAVALAQQVMQEQLFPTGFPMEALKVLPDAVYAQWDYALIAQESRAKNVELPVGWSTPVKLLGEDVTREKLEDLLTQFDARRVQRMEWSWRASIPVGEEQGYEPRRSLVFLKDKAGYACLYFDDFQAESYALLEQPEIYGKNPGRSRQVPFGKSKLFDDVIHRRSASIRRRLHTIFGQVSYPSNVKFMAGGIWAHAEIVSHGRVKYNLDKQLLGNFPMEWACNRPDAPFYFALYPDSAALVDDAGGVEILTVSDLERPRLQEMLARFLQGGFPKLRLTWGKKPGKRAHIVLLRDGSRFLMAWVQEEKRTVQYHAADRWAYMDVEGKKYPKDTFQGRITPAYLIHNGVTPLRNALELLLACMDRPGVITDEMGEYAGEKPVKPRPYETLWAELVGDTLDGE
jgi:hypothetical protein